MPELYRAREVADLLRLEPRTVLDMANRGELASIKLPNGAVRFHIDDVEDMLAKSRRTPTVGLDNQNAPATQERPGADTEGGTFDARPRLRRV
jgi:excisionase family DNA binding protein